MSKIELAESEIELARKTVEDALIDFRNSRVSTLRNNGLCVKEKDGTPSDIIRFGFEYGLMIAIEAINNSRSN